MPARERETRPDIAIVERQMRNWELTRAQRHAAASGETVPAVADFVAISRRFGSGGTEVGQRLSERLGWPLFDRDILKVMAGDDQLRARLYQQLDERDVSWLESTLRWLLQGEFRKQDYFHRLSETVLALARRGRAVFLGRGADLILPQDRGLRVRIIAPWEQCAQNVAASENMAEALARAEVERVDHEHAEYIRKHFPRGPHDVLRHDLLINMERFGVEQAVELVYAALRLRGIVPPGA